MQLHWRSKPLPSYINEKVSSSLEWKLMWRAQVSLTFLCSTVILSLTLMVPLETSLHKWKDIPLIAAGYLALNCVLSFWRDNSLKAILGFVVLISTASLNLNYGYSSALILSFTLIQLDTLTELFPSGKMINFYVILISYGLN